MKVVCMGDSITEGYGILEPRLNYPSILQRLLGEGYEVVNKGVNGCCVIKKERGGRYIGEPYVCQRSYEEALYEQGDIYVVILGTNDASDGYDDELGYQDMWNNVFAYEKEFVKHFHKIITDIWHVNNQAKIYVGYPAPVMNCIWPAHKESYLEVILEHLRQVKKENPMIHMVPIHDIFMKMNERTRASYYQLDGLHPNEKGARLIAETVAASIMKSDYR